MTSELRPSRWSTTVCCLLYGDYPELAYRCLKPISELYNNGVPVRISCNEISDRTRSVIKKLFEKPERLITLENNPQIYKYPAMRELLWKTDPITTDYVMWFDDDSYIKDPSPVKWLTEVENFMVETMADMIGSLYQVISFPKQNEWRRLHCSWFKPSMVSNRTLFATGGWWSIKSSLLSKYDWPHKDLKHRGGDVLLGELIKHEGLRLKKFNKGIAINADENGKESASKRRGYDEPPIGL